MYIKIKNVKKVELLEPEKAINRELLNFNEELALRPQIVIMNKCDIADEESKGGFSPEEVVEASVKISEFPHLRLRGLMTIGRFGAEIEEMEFDDEHNTRVYKMHTNDRR